MFTQGGNLAGFYNSKLGMAWISSENRLTINDVLICCGQDLMAIRDPGPCVMGVDVGRELTVVAGFKPNDNQIQVCYLARVSSFTDLHDIVKRFNVSAAVIDIEPETRQTRTFQAAEKYSVYLCDYLERTTASW
jgi:hypothetical protein